MKVVVAGIAAGFVSGLLGIGGGVVMVPLLIVLAGLTQHQAHATSLGAAIPIALAGAVWFGFAGEVRLDAGAALALGALAGAPLGALVMARTSEKRLRSAFGLLVVAVGISMVLT